MSIIEDMDDRLTAKIQLLLTQEEKDNLDHDLPLLSEQLKKQKGDKVTKSLFLRLCAQDLHAAITEETPIVWPPRLERQP
jgi:hypothetical protein